MKKILLICLLLLSLSACAAKKSDVNNDFSNIGIIAPTGAPSLAFLNYINDTSFETNSSASMIIPYMNENSDKRLVVIDTISGIKAIQKGAPYKLACNITFGNFYIAATGKDLNGVLDEDDKLVIFGKDLTPDVLFHFLYEDKCDKNIEYVDSVMDAGKVLAAGKNFITGSDIDYVLIAEPVLTNVLKNENAPTYGTASIYKNIQEEYKEKTGKTIIQASLFVKDDEYINNFDDFFNYQKTSISKMLNDQEYVNTLLANKEDEEVSSILGVNKKQIRETLSTNVVNIGFVKAYENKETIDYYINLFGMDETNEEIYIK